MNVIRAVFEDIVPGPIPDPSAPPDYKVWQARISLRGRSRKKALGVIAVMFGSGDQTHLRRVAQQVADAINRAEIEI